MNRKRRRIPYLLVYYLLFIMGFSIIKNLAGWNAHTFDQLSSNEGNLIGSALAFLSEIILSLIAGVVLFMIASTRPIGRLVIWATATVIPLTFAVLLIVNLIFNYLNDKWAAEADHQLHTEIISRLPAHTFKKMSGSRNDFTGYVTAGNDSLGLIMADSNKLAKVYLYIDSAKLGPIDFDTCTECHPYLRKILSSVVVPMQSFSGEEVQHNINLVDNAQCYIADRSIYIGYCRKPGKRFIIINNVYDEVRRLHCYEVGFQVDVKTPQPHRLQIFE
jgi:hypothetical protein